MDLYQIDKGATAAAEKAAGEYKGCIGWIRQHPKTCFLIALGLVVLLLVALAL